MRDALHQAFDEVQDYRKCKNYKSAGALVDFLRAHTIKVYPELTRISSADLLALEDWETRSERYLACLCRELAKAANETRDIGVIRDGRHRKNTLEDVQKLRELLN